MVSSRTHIAVTGTPPAPHSPSTATHTRSTRCPARALVTRARTSPRLSRSQGVRLGNASWIPTLTWCPLTCSEYVRKGDYLGMDEGAASCFPAYCTCTSRLRAAGTQRVHSVTTNSYCLQDCFKKWGLSRSSSRTLPRTMQVSTRILGRRTAPFPPFLIPDRVPRGVTQDSSTDVAPAAPAPQRRCEN